MAFPNLGDLFSKLALRGEFEFKFSPGQASRIGAVVIVYVIAFAVISIFVPEPMSPLWLLTGLMVLYIAGTWLVGMFSPESQLDPLNYVKWQALRNEQAAKGLTIDGEAKELTHEAINDPGKLKEPEVGADG